MINPFRGFTVRDAYWLIIAVLLGQLLNLMREASWFTILSSAFWGIITGLIYALVISYENRHVRQ